MNAPTTFAQGSVQECKNECTRTFANSTQKCSNDFSRARRNCSIARNTAIIRCFQPGTLIVQCIRNAINNFNQCSRDAIVSRNNCRTQATAQRLACNKFCESDKPKIIISEIYYSTNPDDVHNEFVELYVEDDKGNKNIDVKNWYIATFDNDKGVLPNITGLDNFDHVSVRMGNGTNDTNATDGNATIFLARNSEMLDNNGDEVGLYNNFDFLQDFVRYEGGNNDPVLGNWQPIDLGPSAANNKESAQIHGMDMDDSSNWISAPASEAAPNIFQFLMPAGNGVLVQIHNGLPEAEIVPIDEIFRSIKFQIVNASGMANLGELKIIEEFLNFSWNFYESRGFNKPEFGGDGDLDVVITTNGDYGASTNRNRIRIDIGNKSINGTIYGVFVKWNIEHEHYHSIQLKRINEDGSNNSAGIFDRLHTPGFGVLNDGPAEYFGLEITKKEFNLSATQIFNISDFIRNTTPGFASIPYTLKELTSTFDTNFTTLPTGELEVYYKGFLFARYIAETYNESKLVHIHNITRRNFSGGGGNIQGHDAIENALRNQSINKSFFSVHRDWTVWVYDNFRQNLGFTLDRKFNGTKIVENNTLTPYGTDYERIRNASAGFDLEFNGQAGQNYSITIIKQRSDGSRSIEDFVFNGTTIIRVEGGFENVTIIKTRINGAIGNIPYGVVIKPLEPRKPKFILDGISSTFNVSADNRSATIKIHALSRFLNKTIFDFEIFNDDQNPNWNSAAIQELPSGWFGQAFGEGLRAFTNTHPLETCTPKEFKVGFNASKVPGFIVIHITNKTHNNIGNIVSQNPKVLGQNVSACPPQPCKGNATNITIDTEIICMDLRGINPIGPVKIKPKTNSSKVNASKNLSLLPGQLFTDDFEVLNSDPLNNFIFDPEVVISCVIGDPDRPYVIGAIYNSDKSPKVIANSSNNSNVRLTVINPCHLEDAVCASIVHAGFDLFETPMHGPTYFEFADPIPHDFFNPGSDPFSGRIELSGNPLGPQDLGTTDTIVERRKPAILHGNDLSDTIPIELVELSLLSVRPIIVTYSGLNPELWDVRASISPLKPSNGSMTIKRVDIQGGTFTSELHVQPKFIFSRQSDNAVRVLDTGALPLPPKILTANNSPWIFEPCHHSLLRVPGLTSNFCPSSNQFGRLNTTHNGTNVSHTVKPATEFYGMKFFGCRRQAAVPALLFRPDFNRNLTPFSQYNRTSWGNQSCGPTCAGVILEYWNRTGFPSIMGNYSLEDLIDRLRNLSGTTEENGTSVFDLVEGITRHLQNRSFRRNFTVTVFESDPAQPDGTETFDGQQNGVGVTSKIDNNFTFSDLTREMANETVIILLQGTQGGHFVAANDYTRNANTDGSHNISLMDPAESSIIYVRMYGNTIELGNENWTIVSIVSVSPVNALPDTDEDGMPDFQESCIDNDGDGYGSHCALGDDCDDNSIGVNPAAEELCDELDNDCDGAVDESFDLSSDINNCGACNAPCSSNHIAVNTCTGGQCTGTCEIGFNDCNVNKRVDGCETNILFDNNNCGACGQVCLGGFFCDAGFCVLFNHDI